MWLLADGMELVNVGRSIFDVISTLFTAVTFHELFKFAALDGNSRLSFGIQWQTILREVGDALGNPRNGFFCHMCSLCGRSLVTALQMPSADV